MRSDSVVDQTTSAAGAGAAERLRRISQLEETVLSFPYRLPDTEEARNWLMELDFIDLIEGPLNEIERMASTAPSDSARSYLLGIVSARSSMQGVKAL